MFARQVDPLAQYNSVISAAEQHHRARQEAFNHYNSHEHNIFTIQPSVVHHTSTTTTTTSSVSSSSGNNDNTSHGRSNGRNNRHATTSNPNKRKHTFHFEPDFFAALDSSIRDNNEETNNDSSNNAYNTNTNNNNNNNNSNNGRSSCSTLPQQGGSPWPSRPLKRAKKSSPNNTQVPLLKVSVSKVTPTNTPLTCEPVSPNAKAPTQTFAKQPRFSPPSKAAFSTHMSHKNMLLKSTPVFRQNSNGPSIIDLSSGEELVVLHLGNNEHKRTRDCEPMSPTGSMDSLREVFEYQDDGNLLPIREYIPTQPSPAKKVRLGRSSHHSSLRFLSEGESDSETRDQDPKPRQSQSQRATSNNGFYRKTKQRRKCWSLDAARRNGFTLIRGGNENVFTSRPCDGVGTDGTVEGDTEMEVLEINTGDITEVDSQSDGFSIEEGNQELIPYQPPAISSLSNELVIDWKLWKDIGHANAIPLTELKGNELVLYKNSSSVGLENNNDGNRDGQEYEVYGEPDDNYQSFVVIEELGDDYGGDDDDDDDDGNMADDEACELSDDGPLIELEERIMDMDLD